MLLNSQNKVFKKGNDNAYFEVRYRKILSWNAFVRPCFFQSVPKIRSQRLLFVLLYFFLSKGFPGISMKYDSLLYVTLLIIQHVYLILHKLQYILHNAILYHTWII